MRIKLDENLPATIALELRELGHDVETIPDEGLTGEPDPRIWKAAQQEQRFLVTQDLDFSDIRTYEPGSHAGVLVVRLREPSRKSLAERILSTPVVDQLESWHRCFVTLTDNKIRVRRPRR